MCFVTDIDVLGWVQKGAGAELVSLQYAEEAEIKSISGCRCYCVLWLVLLAAPAIGVG